MAPLNKIKTYGRSNKSLVNNSLDAGIKMFHGKITKRPKKRKLIIKELPARTGADTFLGQDSFHASIDDTFDKLAKDIGYNKINIKSHLSISNSSDRDTSNSIKRVNNIYSPILTRRRKKNSSIIDVDYTCSPVRTRSKSKSFRNTSDRTTTKNKNNPVFLKAFKRINNLYTPPSMKKQETGLVSETCSSSLDFVNRSEICSKSRIDSLLLRLKEPTVDKIDRSLEMEKAHNPVLNSLSYIIIPEIRDEKTFNSPQSNVNTTKPDVSFEPLFSKTFREKQNIHSSTPLVLAKPKQIVNYTISPIKNISDIDNNTHDKESNCAIYNKDSCTPLKCNYSTNVQHVSKKCEISNVTSSVNHWPQFECTDTSKDELVGIQKIIENKENAGSTPNSRFLEAKVVIPRQSFITLRKRKIFKVNNCHQKRRDRKKLRDESKNVTANTLGDESTCTEQSSVQIKKSSTTKGGNTSISYNSIRCRRLTDTDVILNKRAKKAFRRLSLQDNDLGIALNDNKEQKEVPIWQNKNYTDSHKSLNADTVSFQQHSIYDKCLHKELIVNVTKSPWRNKHKHILPESHSSNSIIDLTDSFNKKIVKKFKVVNDVFTLREAESYHKDTDSESSQIENAKFNLPVTSGICSYQSEVFYGFDLHNGDLTSPVDNSREKTNDAQTSKGPRSVTFSNSQNSNLDNISFRHNSVDKFVKKELIVNITRSPWRIKNIQNKCNIHSSIIDLTDSSYEVDITKSKDIGNDFALIKTDPHESLGNSDIIESSIGNDDFRLHMPRNIWKEPLKTLHACREFNDDDTSIDGNQESKENILVDESITKDYGKSPIDNKFIKEELIVNITKSPWQIKNKQEVISAKGSVENIDLTDSVDKRDLKKSDAISNSNESKSYQKQEISSIIESSLLPDQLEDDGFKMPTLTNVQSKNLILKAGKSWRRSLSLYKRSSMMLTAINKNVQRLADGNSCAYPQYDWVRHSELSNRRNSIRIVPAKPPNDYREKSVLENYAHISSYVPDRIFEDNLESDLRSLSLSKRKSSIVENSVPVTARELVLKRCGQEEPLPFEECYPKSVLHHCQKIGEGVYGEVFLFRNPNGGTSVMKIIPIEGDLIVNGERQKKFEEILSEITIALELSNLRNKKQNKTSGFSEVQKVCCVQGRYPEKLIDLWDLFSETRGSDNDSPEIFGDDQLYIVLQLANGGRDLEAFVFNNALQAYTMFQQVACALAVAEDELTFEHRDLHWGNILLSVVDRNAKVTFWLDGKKYDIMTKGVEVAIIDFTLSRIECDGVVIFNDLSLDPELFTAEGDYQFEIYKLMQKKNGNNWQRFEPYSNILWLHYTLDKAITALHYKNKQSKVHKEYLGKLKQLKDEILNYNSVKEFVTENF